MSFVYCHRKQNVLYLRGGDPSPTIVIASSALFALRGDPVFKSF